MHRSSESVSAIATALAKAQTELSNPEKAMVGMVYSNRSDSLQSFRYASLSSGLDIVRETLGGQQIAVALFEPARKCRLPSRGRCQFLKNFAAPNVALSSPVSYANRNVRKFCFGESSGLATEAEPYPIIGFTTAQDWLGRHEN